MAGLVVADALAVINLHLKIYQNPVDPSFPEDEMKAALLEAIQEYSRFRPVRIITDLDLITNQDAYDWPAGAIDILPFLWSETDVIRPLFAGLTLETDLYYNNWFLCVLDIYASPANLNSLKYYRETYADYVLGQVLIDKVLKKIIILPTPNKDMIVKIPCDRFHALNTGGTAYETILDQDINIILSKTEAILLDILSIGVMATAGKVGDRDYKREVQANFLSGRAQKMHQSFNKYFGTCTATRT